VTADSLKSYGNHSYATQIESARAAFSPADSFHHSLKTLPKSCCSCVGSQGQLGLAVSSLFLLSYPQ
jgi:hypothetical protein